MFIVLQSLYNRNFSMVIGMYNKQIHLCMWCMVVSAETG